MSDFSVELIVSYGLNRGELREKILEYAREHQSFYAKNLREWLLNQGFDVSLEYIRKVLRELEAENLIIFTGNHVGWLYKG